MKKTKSFTGNVSQVASQESGKKKPPSIMYKNVLQWYVHLYLRNIAGEKSFGMGNRVSRNLSSLDIFDKVELPQNAQKIRT